jgi:hypothetical protein
MYFISCRYTDGKETCRQPLGHSGRQAKIYGQRDGQSSGKKAETLSEGGEAYTVDRQRDGGDEPTGRVDVPTGRETRRLAENTCRQAVILVDRQ